MKILILCVACLLSACAATRGFSISESKLVGEFCHASIDASLCLDLKADHTYSESFSGGGLVIVGPNGEMPKVAPEPRGSGEWRLEQNRLLLLPIKGPKRVLSVEPVDGSILLHESLGKYSCDYRR